MSHLMTPSRFRKPSSTTAVRPWNTREVHPMSACARSLPLTLQTENLLARDPKQEAEQQKRHAFIAFLLGPAPPTQARLAAVFLSSTGSSLTILLGMAPELSSNPPHSSKG